MEAAEMHNGADGVVHPEVSAHINSLVSALGGIDFDDDTADDNGAYKLGDDALEVLRDLKRWIRFYDEKTNRMDVARCLADANIVSNDLLQILATWPPNAADNIYKSKIALACFEVMVPLTWPIDRNPENMTINHHRHIPVLQLAQLGYKRAILNFDIAPILGTAVRVALPSMALPIGERTSRDQGIIKLVLYFLRNIALISPPPGVKLDGDESQISRSALIDAFSFQDIFLAILTIASNMGEDFRTEDVIIMEIIFHLVKRVNSMKLFVSEKEANKAKADELAAAIRKEEAMLRSYNKHPTSRHSRFGTMIWVKRENGKMATLTGQEALLDHAARQRKMDKSKTFRPPKKARREDMEPKNIGPPVTLDERARNQLATFVSEFLDSGFNPLFGHLRKSIDREAPHVLQEHSSQFFYLVAWFLEANRMRRKAEQDDKKRTAEEDVGAFNLVAEVLNQEMFITLNRALQMAYTDKNWQLLSTVMRCFTQILLTVQDMCNSGNEDDEEIANNILSRLFYEETTHDAIADIVRTYKDQGFEYLDACTDLTHTYLRILESYSKQNVDLHIRSKKRNRRKKKAAKVPTGEGAEDQDADDDSANDQQDAEKTVQERKFDFKRFSHRFVPQGVVDTFLTFTKYYRDLDNEQLKRAHRYFYRVAFKEEMSVMLFRLDILHLFWNMIKGPEPLDKSSAVFKDWEELSRQLFKRCLRKLEERPALFTELLFSKINSTAHFLEHGHEKQTISTNPKPAAELEFKHENDLAQQIAIVVGVLLDKGQADHIAWVKKQLFAAEAERRAWEIAEKELIEAGRVEGEAPAEEPAPKPAPHTTIRSDTPTRCTAMFKNPYLRLLMKLVNFERLTPTLDETPDSTWIIPGTISSSTLLDFLSLISSAEFSPPTFEDGLLAEDQLRRRPAPRKRRVAYDDDNDNPNSQGSGAEEDGEAFLFAPGGPAPRKADYEKKPPRKRQRRLLRGAGSGEEDGPTEAELDEKAKARRKKEMEKLRKIKSSMYVDADDDETDEETRKKHQTHLLPALPWQEGSQRLKGDVIARLLAAAEEKEQREEREMRRDAGLLFGEEEEEVPVAKASKGKKKVPIVSLEESSDEEDEEAPAPPPPKKKRATAKSKGKAPAKKKSRVVEEEEDEDEDEDEVMGGMTPSSRTATGDEQTRAETEDTSLSVASSPSPAIGKATVEDDEDEDEDVVLHVRQRARTRGGFVVDSSDEE